MTLNAVDYQIERHIQGKVLCDYFNSVQCVWGLSYTVRSSIPLRPEDLRAIDDTVHVLLKSISFFKSDGQHNKPKASDRPAGGADERAVQSDSAAGIFDERPKNGIGKAYSQERFAVILGKYRTVSLTSVFCRFVECTFTNNLHLNPKQYFIPHPDQHGFLKH